MDYIHKFSLSVGRKWTNARKSIINFRKTRRYCAACLTTTNIGPCPDYAFDELCFKEFKYMYRCPNMKFRIPEENLRYSTATGRNYYQAGYAGHEG